MLMTVSCRKILKVFKFIFPSANVVVGNRFPVAFYKKKQFYLVTRYFDPLFLGDKQKVTISADITYTFKMFRNFLDK